MSVATRGRRGIAILTTRGMEKMRKYKERPGASATREIRNPPPLQQEEQVQDARSRAREQVNFPRGRRRPGKKIIIISEQ